MRESVQSKAGRYLVEGRLVVQAVGPGTIGAICRGDGAVYLLGFQDGQWFCTCPARTRCAHLLALHRVTCAPLQSQIGSVLGEKRPGAADTAPARHHGGKP